MHAMVDLSPKQRRYLFLGLCAAPFTLNFIINGITGWGMFHGTGSVPVWSMGSSAGPDTLGTCFFLPTLTCLIVTPIVRWHVRIGTIEPIASPHALPPWLRFFLRPLAVRAFAIGLSCLSIAGGPVVVIFLGSGYTEIGTSPFLWLKAGFAAVLGAVVTPLIGLLALADSTGHASH